MDAVPKVFHEQSINSQNRIFVALRLHHIAHGQCPNISAFLEISRIQRRLPHLVENLAALRPCRKHRRGHGRDRSRDILVFVVFLGSPDDGVPCHLFHHLLDFGLWHWNIDDQARAILKDLFFAGRRQDRRRQEKKYCPETQITREIK